MLDKNVDVIIDEDEETTKADLLKADPSDEEAEKTIAMHIISGVYPSTLNYDFTVEGNYKESIWHSGTPKVWK